jgi:hypothetical protein
MAWKELIEFLDLLQISFIVEELRDTWVSSCISISTNSIPGTCNGSFFTDSGW